jgi:hypothetical protein
MKARRYVWKNGQVPVPIGKSVLDVPEKAYAVFAAILFRE